MSKNLKNGNETWIIYLIMPFILAALLIYGCQDGGGSASSAPNPPPDNSNLMSWIQEPYYEDNTVMDLKSEVKCYEIYVTKSAMLDNITEPIAYVSGVHEHDNIATHIADHFDLELLRPYGINADNEVKWVFMRTESMDNMASQFSQPHQWGVYQLNTEVAVK